MSITTSLTALATAKTDIAAAITAKGGTVNAGDGMSDFAADIGTIPLGVDIDGVVAEYVVAAGNNLSAGDFIQYLESYEHVGAAAALTSNAYTYNAYPVIQAAALDDARVFVLYSGGSTGYLYCRVITIDNLGIALGTETTLTGSDYAGYGLTVVKLNTTDLLIARGYGSTSGGHPYARIVRVAADNTLTLGTEITVDASAKTGYRVHAVKLSATSVFLAYEYISSSYYVYGIVLSISDLTVTAGSKAVIYQSTYGYPFACALTDGLVLVSFSKLDSSI